MGNKRPSAMTRTGPRSGSRSLAYSSRFVFAMRVSTMRFLRGDAVSAIRKSNLPRADTHTCPSTGRASPALRGPPGLAEGSVLGIAVSGFGGESLIVSVEGLPCWPMSRIRCLLYSKSC